MEEYAERLRALHRDLTLVLQAVERGLAAAAHPGDVEPPVPATEPIEIVPEPVGEPPPPAPRPRAERRRMPRVEVMPPPSGEQRRREDEERRQPPALNGPAVRWTTEDAEPGPGDPHAEPAEREAPRPAPPFPSRPSAASEPAPREPRWVERGGDSFTAPTFPPAPAPQRLTVSPLVATAFVVGWLVVVGLLIALLVV